MKGSRAGISKRLRFEIFKRDSFKCQYCGKSAPDVVLEVDHIIPVAAGGKNDIINLVTACYDCNHGKSDKSLGENNELDKQRKQLEQLNERRNQIKMMVAWKTELMRLEDEQIGIVEKTLCKKTGYGFSTQGRRTCAKAIKKYGFAMVFHAVHASIQQYLEEDQSGLPTEESIDNVFQMYPRICFHLKNEELNPGERELYYIRGILRNRLAYCDQIEAINLLRQATKAGLTISELKYWAGIANSWNEWKDEMERSIEMMNA